MTLDLKDPQNRDELLAWYVNGTLDEAERAEVERWLDSDPEARLALAEYEFMAASVAEQGDEEPSFAVDAGLDRLMAQIDSEQAQSQNHADTAKTASTSNTADSESGPFARLANWLNQTLQWQLTPNFAKVAVVSQFALVMALGAAVLLLDNPNGGMEPGYEVLSGQNGGTSNIITDTTAIGAPQADIGLNPQTTLAQLQQLLKRHQARIIDGPNSIGVYRIAFTDTPAAPALAQRLDALKAEAAVSYLEQVVP